MGSRRAQLPDGYGNEVLLEMLDNNELIDVCINVDGQKFNAHKFILATKTPYFKSQFAFDPRRKSGEPFTIKNIDFSGCSAELFPMLLRYMYGERFILTVDNVAEVLKAADILLLEALKNDCMEFLGQCPIDTPAGFLSIWKVSREYSLSQTKEKMEKFLAENTETILDEKNMLQLCIEEVQDMLSPYFPSLNPQCLYWFFNKWLRHDFQARSPCVILLMKNVRFADMPEEFLATISSDNELLNTEAGLQLLLDAWTEKNSNKPQESDGASSG